MADLTSAGSYFNTYDNSGTGIAASKLGGNFLKHVINQADVGRELIVKVVVGGGITDAILTSIRNNITLSGGVAGALPANTGDAFTVAAIGTADGTAFSTGVTTTVFMRVQGTGTFSTVDAAGSTGATVTVEATFAPAL